MATNKLPVLALELMLDGYAIKKGPIWYAINWEGRMMRTVIRHRVHQGGYDHVWWTWEMDVHEFGQIFSEFSEHDVYKLKDGEPPPTDYSPSKSFSSPDYRVPIPEPIRDRKSPAASTTE